MEKIKPEYDGITGAKNSYISMKSRCLSQTHRDYHLYGGRGITICSKWANSFDEFLKDMGPRPENYSIDRINVNGNYEPNNCRWADQKMQTENRRPRSEWQKNISDYTRMVVFVDANLKQDFEEYCFDNGHSQKWLITYLLRELVNKKIEIKPKISTYRRGDK